MGNVISNLKAKFGVDSSDFKKGLKDGEKATDDFKSAAGGALDEFAGLFGVSMSSVNSSLGTANKSLSFLGHSLKSAATSSNVFSVALKVLKFALISTGIGALVVALGSLITYFKDTGEGADRFAVIMAKIRSVIDNIIDRFQTFGGGLADIFAGRFKEGWEQMRGAFKGIGEEIREDWKAAGDLENALDAVEDREIELITSLEARRQKIAELREEARDLELTEKERLDRTLQAELLIKSVTNDQVALEQERLRIMKEQLDRAASDPTDEQRREIAEQEAKINSLLAAQANELRTLSREKNTLLKVVKEELALEKAKAEQVAVTNAAISGLALPDFNQLISNALAPMPAFQAQIKETMVDITDTINGAFENMAVGMGEFIGALATGNAGMKDFGVMMAASFADLAVTVGKIVIQSALAVGGIAQALKIPGAWPVALAAGVALVAIGSAVRGALSGASSSSASGRSSSASGYTYDLTGVSAAAQKVTVSGKVEVVAKGSDLKGVLDFENDRRNRNT